MTIKQEHCVMVTGAGSGIGYAAAQALLNQGYAVFGGAIDQAEADKITQSFGNLVTPVILDVGNEDSVQAARDQVGNALNGRPLVALLNIAGVITNGPLVDLSAGKFQQILTINVIGTHNVTRAFLPLLMKHAGSRVINTSSSSGTRTLPFTGAYSASKFGVEALSTAMRYEFKMLGIHVVVIAPANIKTPMAEKIQNELKKEPSLAVYKKPLQLFLANTVDSFTTKGISPERVAEAFVKAVTSEKPARRYEVHSSYFRDAILMRKLPVGLIEKAVLKTLALDKAYTMGGYREG
ncbi:MAG TPA: SDR family NAD(P)-dependent oxidoreductase [Methanoregulaceae archaeon]|nr:SDR family NAD(P)-dependent oxidoreductase [Methanoregulaceae archaeon]